jgi:hypothetical protein
MFDINVLCNDKPPDVHFDGLPVRAQKQMQLMLVNLLPNERQFIK